MKVTQPMIERGAQALVEHYGVGDDALDACTSAAEACLRGALGNPVEQGPMPGQTSIAVDDNGNTVVHG